MKQMLKSLMFVAMVLMFLRPPVYGGAVVYDPTNWAQNNITALQSVRQTINQATQITRQIQQIQNEMNMLINQGRMLAQLPTSLQNDIIHSIQGLETIIANARGIVLDYHGLQSQFDDLYRTADYGGWTGQQYRTSVERLSAETIDAANNAMEAQGLIADLDQDRLTLDSLLSASKSAEGQLGALQAANEIAGIMTTNLMRLETIMAESARVESVHIAGLEKTKQDSRARFQAGLETLRNLGTGTPTFTPINDQMFLNPIGPRQGDRE